MDKGKRVSNRESYHCTSKREPFHGSNLWGAWVPSTIVDSTDCQYVVFSYGHHYPMFIYAGGMWFENEDRYELPSRLGYSASTERQRSQCRPVPITDTHKLNTAIMCTLATVGITELRKRRILGDI